MKFKNLTAIAIFFVFSNLIGSPEKPNASSKSLRSTDTVKVVIVYALGEWDTPQKLHQHDQNTPLPGYAFDICDTLPPGISNYYKSVSMKKFMVSARAWHNDGKCYVMQGMHTPTSAKDTTKGPFVDSLIKRIDSENVWSFVDNAMWWPDNDNPGANDTPFTWIFVVWPESYGVGWGQAPGGWWDVWIIPTDDSLYNPSSNSYKRVYAHIFGLSRQPSSYRSDAVAGIIHEFNHQWFPDIGYNPDHYGLGGFDPECAGMGFYDAQGGLPSPVNPVWRAEAGWINKVGFPGSIRNRVIQDVSRDTLYSLGDFYVSLHLGQNYYEAKWPGQGLLIWHSKMFPTGFNYSGEEFWANGSYLMKPLDLEVASGNWTWNGLTRVAADPVQGRDNLDMRPWGLYASNPALFKGVGDSSCFFNPRYGYSQFDGLTNPSSRTYVSTSDTLGAFGPPNCAVRNIRIDSQTSMKADFLLNYCIGSVCPAGSISTGANNQRNLMTASTWLDPWGKYRFYHALAYTESDSVWVRVSEDFSRLSESMRQLVGTGTGPQTPGFYSHGQNDKQLAICWIDGSNLFYRHGTLDTNKIIQWDTEAFPISSLVSGPDFTAPTIVVRPDDTVFLAAAVRPSSSLTGNSNSYPVLCFRFHKLHPEDAKVDVLDSFFTDYAHSSASVSLGIDALKRVHAVFTSHEENSGGQGLMHRCFASGNIAWSDPKTVMSESSDFSCAGAPCVEYYDGYLNVVAAACRAGDLHQNIFYSSLNVKQADISDQWSMPVRVSDDIEDARDPIICGGSVSSDRHHIFWIEPQAEGDTDLFYKCGLSGKVVNISNTPHALTSAPQSLYTDGKCFVLCREHNSYGSELDLRTITSTDTFGGIPAGDILPSVSLELELSSSILSGKEVRVKYLLPHGTGHACMKIYDCQGRLINEWPLASRGGWVSWDGRNARGLLVPSGVYFVRLQTDNSQTGRKIVKLN